MKKAISLLLALVMALSLCACASSTNTQDSQTNKTNTYEKVTFSDGSTETLELGEIPSMIHENQYAYNQKYAGNKIEVVTTVTSIGSSYGMAGFVPIKFAGGWDVYLKESTSVIVDLRNGTTVKITGTLQEDSWSIGNATVTIIE